MTERRKENMIKGVVMPVVVAVVTGIGSSYLTVSVTLAVLETRVDYVESDIVSMKHVIEKVNDNHTELIRQNDRLIFQERRLESVEDDVSRIDRMVRQTQPVQ